MNDAETISHLTIDDRLFIKQARSGKMSSNAHDKYLATIGKCQQLCELLDSFEPTNQPQYPALQSLYSVDNDLLRINAARNIQGMLTGFGMSTSELVYVDVRSPGKSDHGDAASTNHVDGKSGLIICSEKFKIQETNPPGKRLWPSEIIKQSWIMAVEAKGSKPFDLQVIIRLISDC